MIASQESSDATSLTGSPRVSALVTCYNEEADIAACLEGLTWCDEILVVDSFSTDSTPEIARRFPKVRLLQHAYYGGAAQKNWAMPKTRHEWILIFDADERCTDALRREIQRVVAAHDAKDAYVIRRRTFFLGEPLRFSGWRNDRVVRLLRRGKGQYQNRRVHARIVTGGPEPAYKSAPILKNPMDHHMVDDLPSYLERLRRYGYWGAGQLWRDGRRTTAWEVFRRTAWRFVRSYVVQLGFLDGGRGFLACAAQAIGTYARWGTLWAWQAAWARGIEPRLPEFREQGDIWAAGSTPAEERSAPPPARVEAPAETS